MRGHKHIFSGTAPLISLNSVLSDLYTFVRMYVGLKPIGT
jgi:hypothetical protein